MATARGAVQLRAHLCHALALLVLLLMHGMIVIERNVVAGSACGTLRHVLQHTIMMRPPYAHRRASGR
jgi:hypothetical protein